MNNYYYTKNYKNRATDLRQDQKPKTTTTHETTNDKVNPPSEPTDVNLQTTDCTRKTMNRKKDVAIQVLTATIQLNKKDKMLYVPLQFREYENHGLLDTGAIRSAMSEDELRRILSAHPPHFSKSTQHRTSKSKSQTEASSRSGNRYYFASSSEVKYSRKPS